MSHKVRTFAILSVMSTPKIPASGLHVMNSKTLWSLLTRGLFPMRQRLGAIFPWVGFPRILIKLSSTGMELRSEESFFRMIEPTECRDLIKEVG